MLWWESQQMWEGQNTIFFSFIEFKQPKKNFFENSSTISNFFEGVESWEVSWLLIGLIDKMINQLVGQ